jgi:hypothetical protein
LKNNIDPKGKKKKKEFLLLMARISPCTSAMFLSTFWAVLLLVVSISATQLTEEIVEDQQAVESKRVRQNNFFYQCLFLRLSFLHNSIKNFLVNFASFLNFQFAKKKKNKNFVCG